MTEYWQALQVAMHAKTRLEAEVVVIKLIEMARAEDPTLNYGEAKAIQLKNIGYFTGYLSNREEQRRILDLYQTEHPIFGNYGEEVTPEKALKAGMMLGSLISEGGQLTPETLEAAREIIRQP
jgi:hypothetical protein